MPGDVIPLASKPVSEQSAPAPVRGESFPVRRLRRLRRTETLRRMVRETRLSVDQLIYPLFIAETVRQPQEIASMPGQYQWPLDELEREIESVVNLGIPAVLLFGIPAEKDELGSQAYHPEGIVQRAIRKTKALA
ncbi:MAG TPA: hypothetical protein VH593_04460, partial [Ktedonobacteraceae bacterium]